MSWSYPTPVRMDGFDDARLRDEHAAWEGEYTPDPVSALRSDRLFWIGVKLRAHPWSGEYDTAEKQIKCLDRMIAERINA